MRDCGIIAGFLGKTDDHIRNLFFLRVFIKLFSERRDIMGKEQEVSGYNADIESIGKFDGFRKELLKNTGRKIKLSFDSDGLAVEIPFKSAPRLYGDDLFKNFVSALVTRVHEFYLVNESINPSHLAILETGIDDKCYDFEEIKVGLLHHAQKLQTRYLRMRDLNKIGKLEKNRQDKFLEKQKKKKA